jgi:hypothetical protein
MCQPFGTNVTTMCRLPHAKAITGQIILYKEKFNKATKCRQNRGPVLGGVMPLRAPVPRGLTLWLRGLRGGCSVRTAFPTTKIAPAGPQGSLPRPHDHDSTTRDSRGPRRGRPGRRARSSGALGASMQRESAVPGSFVQNTMTRIASLD